MDTIIRVGAQGRERRSTGAARLAALILLAIAAILVWVPRAGAVAGATVTPGEARSGALLLEGTEPGRYVEAPRLGTDVDLVVSGPTARARVTQVFRNPTDGWVEAVYVYPLPEGAAVDTLKMVVGERVVIGELKERAQARAAYEQARAAGQKAGLLEQERPNLFTNAIANIGPGETVLIQIEYQEPVRAVGAEGFSLRLPLVVAPRYSPPAAIVQAADFGAEGSVGSGWGGTTDPVPDRDRITPPVLDPRVEAPANPVTIAVRLQAGFPLSEVKSHHHPVRIAPEGDDTRLVTLEEGPVPADRDFELTWRPAAGKGTPSVGLFRERVGDADYLLAYVTPPAVAPTEERRPREVVFVIDNSGSMGGTSMAQAKASLLYGLGRLAPTDRFNVVRFDNTHDVLFPDAVPADGENLARAKAFVSALEARGGTEMVPAMRAALTDPRRETDAGGLRQVVFLTDGAIGNEQQLFDTVTGMRGRSRVFMVGIGSAPNGFLMTRAAELGRGTFTPIGSVAQVEERMRALFEKLESPAVTGLAAAFPDGTADVTPAILPDLYRGEPLVFAAKLASLDGSLAVSGRIGDRPWSVTLPLARAAEGRGLSKLWARRKIAEAEVGRTLRRLSPEEADRLVLALALDHHLVTRLTSLVAVDRTPSRPDGAPLTRADIPLNLPAGWDADKLFGERPARRAPAGPSATDRADATPSVLPAPASPIKVASAAPAAPAAVRTAAPVSAPANAGGGVTLPNTATDAELRLLVGLLLCAASLFLAATQPRRPRIAR